MQPVEVSGAHLDDTQQAGDAQIISSQHRGRQQQKA
jgi:hypothetical protein